jgi:single-strand DNA-binding protein
MYQKLLIVGHLGRDPEMRYTPSGQTVTNFNVATNRRWTSGEGQQQEETVWFRVTVWGRQAETCNQYLSKGQLVMCEGRMTPDRETGGPRVWTDQNGTPRASYEMTALTVRFLGSRGEAGGFDEGGSDIAEAGPDITEEEIPF